MTLKLGILDQSIVFPEFGPREALRYTVELAQLAEQWGYEQFWVRSIMAAQRRLARRHRC